jgi:hypothetical protein
METLPTVTSWLPHKSTVGIVVEVNERLKLAVVFGGVGGDTLLYANTTIPEAPGCAGDDDD